jgi:hypothetical protein
MLPILQAGYPMIWGEVGETYDGSDCGTSYVSAIVGWADSHHTGYEAWAWDTSGSCLALIENYDGTPANRYGAWIRSHYETEKSELLTDGSRQPALASASRLGSIACRPPLLEPPKRGVVSAAGPCLLVTSWAEHLG